MSVLRILLTMFVLALAPTAWAVAADVRNFQIEAGVAAVTLNEFSRQADVQVLFDADATRDVRTRAVIGRFDPPQALVRMLDGTDFVFEYVNPRTIAVTRRGAEKPALTDASTVAAPAKDRIALLLANSTETPPSPAKESSTAATRDDESRSMPEVLVRGKKSLNMDIRRTQDDAQPYVIFDRSTIEASGAINLEDFLKQRLTMNNVGQTPSQFPSPGGNSSRLNLRGLGFNQTLILVDGHRTAGPVTVEGPQQTDLNGIPLSAVERIEVLPTTASGIYGGRATGGVINIVLRRSYSGSEMKLTWEDTFDGSAPTRRIDGSTGFSLEGGKTDVLIAGSYSQADALSSKDRLSVHQDRGRRLIFANNPNFYAGATNPPLGYTTNIRSANGSPLFGPGTSSITFVPVGYAGGGGSAPLQGNAGKFNFDLAQTAQRQGGAYIGLTNSPTVESLIMTVRRDFTDRVQGFLEVAASNNSSEFRTGASASSFTVNATAPNNPFGQNIRVTVPIADADGFMRVSSFDRRVTGGAIWRLPREWRMAGDYTWDRVRSDLFGQPTNINAQGAALVANGTINVLRDTNLYPLDFSAYLNPQTRYLEPSYTTLKNATVRLAGPVWTLPAGKLGLSTAIERREEIFGENRYFIGSVSAITINPEQSQSVESAYVELQIPLASTLQLQVAGRHERYTLDGSNSGLSVGQAVERRRSEVSSTNPTIGVHYQPFRDVALRASYGTGFLPPSVGQLVPLPAAIDTFSYSDPRRGNSPVSGINVINGGNPSLRPEESESWSAGVILTPRFLEGLRVSVDYTRIDKTDNISGVGVQTLLDNEAALPGRVTRGPVAGDPYGVGVVTAVDATLVNIAKASIETYDAQVGYNWATSRAGQFELLFGATWQPHYQIQLAPTLPITENVGVDASFAPLKFKANATATWTYGQWTLGWATRYFDSYLVSFSAGTVANQGGDGRIGSQTYHDVYTSYEFARRTESAGAFNRLLGGAEVRLGIKNVFNDRPPFDAAALPAFYSYLGDPRLQSYSLSIKQAF